MGGEERVAWGQGSGVRGLRVFGSGVWGLGFRAWGSDVQGLGFGVYGLGQPGAPAREKHRGQGEPCEVTTLLR